MDKGAIEAEFLACAGLCMNDWNYGNKDILLLNCHNEQLLQFLDSMNYSTHFIGASTRSFNNIRCYERAIDLKHNEFDLIIDFDNKTSEHLIKILKKNSVLITNLSNIETDVDAAIDEIQRANFNIKMPFKVLDRYFLFLSNSLHPLADLCLQKIDMIDGLEYYNAKIHEAAFAMPNYIKSALKGIAKN